MKQLTNVLKTAPLALLMLASCAGEEPWRVNSGADGRIYLNLVADGSVNMGSRADNMSPLVPNASEFSVALKSSDGSYSNSWASLAAFNKEEGFPMGSYTISAFYGDMEQEGFNNPYFYGENTVNVALGEKSTVSVTAKLANAMVSIRYTDQFRQFFEAFSGIVETPGHNPVVYVQNETRPGYVSVGKADLKLTLTRVGGETVTVSPSSFVTEPQKHYIVTIGVTGNVDNQNAALSVEWSEELVEESREIWLTDELFSSPEPEIRVSGYKEEGQNIFQGIDYSELNPEFQIYAFAKIESAELSVSTVGGTLPPFGGSVQLVNADASAQANLRAAGVDCSGLYRNVGEMAVINLKDFVSLLQPGSYTVSLKVTDALGRIVSLDNDLSLKVTVDGIEYSFVGYDDAYFLDKSVTVYVATNCDLIANRLSFRALDANGEFADAQGVYVDDNRKDGIQTDLPYVYKYNVNLSDAINDSEWKVRAAVGSGVSHEMTVPVIMPQFSVECDPFARFVKLRLSSFESRWSLADIVNNVAIYKGDKKVSGGIDRYPEDGIVVVSKEISGDMRPEVTYSDYSVSLGKSLYSGYRNNVPEFTTEAAALVPNGDFESLETPKSGTMNAGGTWRTSAFDIGSNYQNTAEYSISEATGWATTNAKTFGATNNTWFSQPSVFATNVKYVGYFNGYIGIGRGNDTPESYKGFSAHGGATAMVIRNVAWDPAGKVPSIDTSSKGTSDYYNHTVPTIAYHSVGKMFLGTYSYSAGAETYTNGIEFTSRPSQLSGWWTYKNDEGDSQDMGKVTVIVYHDDEVIASGVADLDSRLSFDHFSIPLVYKNSDFGKKATKISVFVESSQYGSEDMTEETQKVSVTTYVDRFASYQHGATLVVDDFEFGY